MTTITERPPPPAGTAAPPRARVLVVEDDELVARLVADALTQEGYAAEICTRSREALDRLRQGNYDLVICDVMMPTLDGISLCLELRRETDVPIIFLSARSDVTDRIIGLRAGADDYLAKPFSVDELLLRTERVLRRWRPGNPARQTRVGRVVIDTGSRQAIAAGRVLPLTPTEFKLLAALVTQPDRVFAREELLSSVWNYAPGGDTRLVDVHIGRLRRKLVRAAVREVRIETARGFGYRLVVA